MAFSSVLGQTLAVQLCQRWLEQGSNHPLLFFGPEGVGKKKVALELAKALNCLGSEGRGSGGSEKESKFVRSVGAPSLRSSLTPTLSACDACPSCHKIDTSQHPDVRVVDLAYQALHRGEPIEKQQSIRIETVLEERKRLLQSPVEGAWKVSVLDDAQRMTADAANVLLKILEEPPANTAILLLTPFRDRLFATVVSRCQPIRFRPLTDEEMQQALTQLGIAPNLQMGLIELSLGSLGRALHMSREEQIELAQESDQLWQTLAQGPHGHTGARGRGTKLQRAQVEQKLQGLLMPALRDLHAGKMDAIGAIQLIQQALTRLRQNVQATLVYDHLLLSLADYRHAHHSKGYL